MLNDIPSSLVNGGDCTEHYHLSDRQPHHDLSKGLEELKNVTSVSADYTVKYADDYILVDSTSGVVTVTVPLARGGFLFTVVRIAGANNVNIATMGSDTINGAASVSIVTSYVPQTFKAVPASLFAGYVRVA